MNQTVGAASVVQDFIGGAATPASDAATIVGRNPHDDSTVAEVAHGH